MSGLLNTIQLFCGDSTRDAVQFAPLKDVGYAIEITPADSYKHIFHFTGRMARSIAAIFMPRANASDIFTALAESELGNPFMVWSPEETAKICQEMAPLLKKYQVAGILTGDEDKEFQRLRSELKTQRKPIIFYGPREQWKALEVVYDHMAACGVMRGKLEDKVSFCSTPEDIRAEVEKRMPPGLTARDFEDHKNFVYELGADAMVEHFAKDDPRARPRISLAFFGSATTKRKDHLETARKTVGMCLNDDENWGLVNGGGSNMAMGIMSAQAMEAKKLGIHIHGISANDRGAVGISGTEKDKTKITSLYPHYTECKDMIHRIEYYLEHAEGISAVDGGLGSLQEITMVLELFRQGHRDTSYQDTKGMWHQKPLIIIDENKGTDGQYMWEPVINWLKDKYGEQYVAPLKLVHSVEDAKQLFAEQFKEYPPKLHEKAIDRIVQDAEKKLSQHIPGLKPVEKATLGRPKTIKDWQEMMSVVDLTNLKLDATKGDITALCEKARLQHTRSVCVRAKWVPLARKLLKKSGVKVITVTNFPDGVNTGGMLPVEDAVKEMKAARDLEVDEIDTLFPRHLLKEGRFFESYVYLKRVIESVKLPVKVILETSDLTPEQIADASIIAKEAGATFVKTSTGFHANGGATVEAIEIMRRSVGDGIQIKASGGVRDFEQAMAMIEAGADVIGASSISMESVKQRGRSEKIVIPKQRMNERNRSNLATYAMVKDDKKTIEGAERY